MSGSGGGSPLEGGEALGLSASLWGEQVISYVGSGVLANRATTPGRVAASFDGSFPSPAPVFVSHRRHEYDRSVNEPTNLDPALGLLDRVWAELGLSLIHI